MKHEVILGRSVDGTRDQPLRAGIPLHREDGTLLTMDELKQAAVDYAITFHSSRSKAAEALGIGRSTLYRRA